MWSFTRRLSLTINIFTVLDTILIPCHWFQLADNTAIITILEGDNQLLCNVFTKWVSWVDPIIRVDKCHTFGMKKSAKGFIQYLPNIMVQRETIPPVESNESFIDLGKQFIFKLNIQNIKTDIINDMTNYVRIIDKLPQTTLNKISIVQIYVFNELRSNRIKTSIKLFWRNWCQLPVCPNVKHLSFPLSKLVINFKSANMLYNQCKLSTRQIRQSKNPEIQKLKILRSSRLINQDCSIKSVFSENESQVYLISSLILGTVNLTKVYLKHTWSKFIN